MDKLDYILTRIADGARVRVATDYFGQPFIEVPRRWLPGTRRIALSPAEMDEVRDALGQRRARRGRQPRVYIQAASRA